MSGRNPVICRQIIPTKQSMKVKLYSAGLEGAPLSYTGAHLFAHYFPWIFSVLLKNAPLQGSAPAHRLSTAFVYYG